METQKKEVIEKHLHPLNGYLALALGFLVFAGGLALAIFGGINQSKIFIGCAIPIIIVSFFSLSGLKTVAPNEAIVLLLFGKYKGTIASAGFYWVNPFCTRAGVGFGKPKVSLKALTLDNEKQKVNDADGNPIEIGVVVIWRIIDTAKALFQVDNYNSYVSIQTDSAIRQVARMYPYDADGSDEKCLRGSSNEVAEVLRAELQSRTVVAGIEILDTRISHLAYAPEIAQVMLQRQQANAIIAARQKIVEGAVSMVDMALKKIHDDKIVKFDEASKAQMVSNLLVILCSNKDAQPIINSSGL